MVAVLQEFVSILVGGIQAVGTAVGQGISHMAESMFLVTTTDTTTGAVTYSLSVFGGILAVFAGLSLCIALGRLVYIWISSLGARH